MKRREFIVVLGGATTFLWVSASSAQQAKRVFKVGHIEGGLPSSSPYLLGAFRTELRRLGYVEGENLFIERRYAEGRRELLRDFAVEFVNLGVDVIFTVGPQIALVAATVTDKVPIVFVGGGDPVEIGLVKSLAQPGGNVTGLTLSAVELAAKRVQLLKEAVPLAQRLGIVWNMSDPINKLELEEASRAGRTLALDLLLVEVRTADDFESAFRELARDRVEAALVLVSITDPVAGGFVESLARPGKNITGFTNYEFSMGGKWLEILKGIAPATARVLLMLNPDWGIYYTEYLRSIEAAALSFAVQTILAPVHNAEEMERAISAVSREPGGGLIVLPSAPITAHSEVIVRAAAQHKIPAVYPFRRFVANGGLAFYGTDLADLFRRTASYVDRILKGAAPADLPVQQPTKFEFVINLKTAKILGLQVPPSLVARADEVVE